MKLFVAPGRASDGATLLKEELGGKLILVEGSKYKYKDDHFLIGWGNSQKKDWYNNNVKMLNHPDKVAIAVDKTATLKLLQQNNVSVPEFTTDINIAKSWVANNNPNNNKVFCRTLTRSSGGDGIVIASLPNEVVNAPLYTLYKKKKYEYRVAVVDGVVIDFMAKKKRTDWNVELNGEIDNYIRSHDRGWVFCRENINPPQIVKDLAKKSVKVLGLDFASVDIIYNETENKAYILELNSSPGLEPEGTSLQRYANAFKALVNNQPIQEAQVIGNAPVQPAPIQNNNIPTPAPAAQPQVQAAQVNIINNTNATKKNKKYTLQGLTDIEITEENGITKITGKAQGINHKLKILSVKGSVDFWFGED